MDTNSSISFIPSFPQNETANFSNKDIRLLSDIQLDYVSSLLPIYKYLNLSNNNITTMDADFIKQFVNINYINISNNKISKIQGVESLNSLKYLDVSNNEIALIESMGNCNETLERLNAFHNNIQSIFLTSPMNKLEFIDVRDNQISKISFGIFVPHLRVLKIDNNKNLSDISDLSNFNELEFFSASSNQISQIPKLTKNTLKTINLSNNKITSLSSLNQTKLDTLDVSSNPINDNGINSQLEINKNLRNLFISSSEITRCYCLAKVFPNLSTIELSRTKLNDLNDLLSFVHEMKNLKVLNVRNTPLTHGLYPEADNSLHNGISLNKRFDSISSFNLQFPENSEQRMQFRSEVLKSAISRLQTLDFIQVSSDEYQAIKGADDDLMIEEEEEIGDDNDGYNLDDNLEDEEESSINKIQRNDQISSETTYQNEKIIQNEYIRLNSKESRDAYEISSDDDKPSSIKIDSQKSYDNNNNNNQKNKYSSNDNDSDNEVIQSFINFNQNPNNSSDSSTNSNNNNINYINNGSSYKTVNQFTVNSQPFSNNPHLYNFLTRDSDDSNEFNNFNTNNHSNNSKQFNNFNAFTINSNKLSNSNELDDFGSNDEEEGEEEDDVLITTQIITQALNSTNDQPNISRNIDYINKSVQNEIDSIYIEQKKRHNEKMKKIKKLKKENKILEEEIEKYRLKRLARLKVNQNQNQKINSDENDKFSRNSDQLKIQSNTMSKNKKSSSSHHHSHTNTNSIQTKNSSTSHHHSHSKSSTNSAPLKKSSTSHNQHSYSHSNKNSRKNSSNSHHHSHSSSNSKISIQSTSTSLHNSHLNVNSQTHAESSSNSRSHSSNSNSYIVKTSTKSISIKESEAIPNNNYSNDAFDNDNNSDFDINIGPDKSLDSVKKSKKSSKAKDDSKTYPNVMQLIDGLLAENDQLGGKISSSIKNSYNSTPTSPNQNTYSTRVKPFTISSSSQKVSKNSHHSSSSKKTSNQYVSPQAHKIRSRSIQILRDEINHMKLPFVTREYAEHKLIQSLISSGSSPLNENSDELKYLLLWLVKGLPLSPKIIKLNSKDITMARDLSVYSYNLKIKAIDKNKNLHNSANQLKKLQLLMLFNLNNDDINDEYLSLKDISSSSIDLDLLFNFDIDNIPNDAEFFKNLNYFFKGMPPSFGVTVCAVDLGSQVMLMNAKAKPSKHKQEKYASRGFDSICYEKNGHQCYILFDKSRAMPVYTLLFSTI